VFVCISPWNFPLAIFLGQVVAALAAGNSVIAKPAEQTTLIGHAAVKLLHEAGIPEDVLQFVPCDGRHGSVLAQYPDPRKTMWPACASPAPPKPRAHQPRWPPRARASIAALIAETGGQNAMIADSSALPEQVVKDVWRRRSPRPASAARPRACCSCRTTSPTRSSPCSPAPWPN
jgi:RHH-type proline utilization regulon transcriptional repressor/proline dehydrogenase/delta 1-pyrroline-5-carboxylate dehydrogenase